MSKETTQTDVSEEKAFSSNRLDQLNALAKKVDSEKELEDYDEDAFSARFQGLEDELAGKAQEDADDGKETPDLEVAPPVYQKEDGKWYTKTKVYGNEEEVSFEELRTRAQKAAAADQRFQEVSARQRMLDQRDRELSEREQRLQQLPAQDVTEEAQTNIRELARKYREALLEGDDDVSDELFEQLLTTRQSEKVDVNALKNEVFNDLYQRQENERRAQELTVRATAYQRFAEENQDIVSDPHLFAMADSISTEISSSNPGLSPDEVFALTAKQVKSRTNITSDTRTDRKRATASVPGLSAKQTPAPKAPPRTTGSIIQSMRAARGQA